MSRGKRAARGAAGAAAAQPVALPGEGPEGLAPDRAVPDGVEAARVLARLARLVEQTCQESGVSLPQYRLLAFVARTPQRASELAGRASVSRPTLTALVDGLARQELLRRVPVAGDRRGIRLELTPAGEKALVEADRRLAAQVDELARESGASGLVEALVAVGALLDRRFAARMQRRLGDA